MYPIYRITAFFGWLVLRFLSNFNPKLLGFVNGRKALFSTLSKSISAQDRVIWMHAASLGEYEQGLPVLERIKQTYPSHKLLLTFFSPSGYEIKKNSTVANVVVYLPFDTKKQVRRFLDMVRPELALFVKYEIWPTLMYELDKRNIPKVLFSAIFKKEQIYFKWYGGLMKNSLARFDYIFVQDELSEELLRTQGITQCSVAGDTRFDRVSEILDRDNQLDFMETFKNGSLCFVAGSTWPEDEVLLLPYIEQSMANLKFVIAPHKVSPQVIEQLQTNIGRSAMRYSQLDSNKLQETRVLIIDTIGLLTKIYSYADMAYVGGGFVTGLHNTLEPAAFGVPILIGPNFYGFKEAEELVNIGGLVPVNNKEQFQKELTQWVENEEERYALGQKNKRFVLENRGARDRVMEAVRLFLNKPQNSGKNR